ncbi:MAG: hypothetical protein F2884_04980 [Actinobacteria bacterium]|jgi:hypothetical protein|uniref:Unannotated protein n=1 Tax=freshwater metagenome TaxID=449393 RepID=A0A6J7PB59_9ZZZZ|nr:hypothetical protein [Actinomycetota bacterium]
MLSWSGTEQGLEISLENVKNTTGGVDVSFARELVDFATAATEFDTAALTAARNNLIDIAGLAVVIDASAVIANFEMMTRLADSTGARMQTEVVQDRLAVATAMGVDKVISRR